MRTSFLTYIIKRLDLLDLNIKRCFKTDIIAKYYSIMRDCYVLSVVRINVIDSISTTNIGWITLATKVALHNAEVGIRSP